MKSIDDALELRGPDLRRLRARRAGRGRGARRSGPLTFVVVGAGPTGVEMAGQIAELAQPHPEERLPPDRPDQGPDHPRRRRRHRCCRRSVSGSAARPAPADRDGRRRAARHEGHRRRRHRHHGQAGRRRLPRIEALDQGLGRGCAGEPARPPDRRAVGRRDRPRGTGQGAPRPHRARPPRGVRRRRHDVARRAAGRGPGRHPGRAVRGRADQAPARRQGAERRRSSTSTRARWRRSRGSARWPSIGRLRFSGFFAWVLWLAIHLVYIIGFKHRVTTLLHWAVSFLGRGRSERVATEQQVFARRAMDALPHGEVPSIPSDPPTARSAAWPSSRTAAAPAPENRRRRCVAAAP